MISSYIIEAHIDQFTINMNILSILPITVIIGLLPFLAFATYDVPSGGEVPGVAIHSSFPGHDYGPENSNSDTNSMLTAEFTELDDASSMKSKKDNRVKHQKLSVGSGQRIKNVDKVSTTGM